MRKVLIVILLSLFAFTTPAAAWVVVCDPYIPVADGSVGIPTEFVFKIDTGVEQTVPAVDPNLYPKYFTAPTGGFPAGSMVMIVDVTAYKGNHTLTAKARNAEGESIYSNPFAFNVPVKPAALGGMKLLK